MYSYKILRIAGLHYSYLLSYLEKALKELSYSQQKKHIFACCYQYSDSFSKAMNQLGHDAEEIIYDFKLLQTTWAHENNISFDKKTWQREILFSQIKKIKPEILYFQDVHSLSIDDFSRLKTLFPFIKKIVVFRGYPGLDLVALKKISFADIICVGSPILITKLKKHGMKANLVYHFFDEVVLEKIAKQKPKFDLTFIGSSGFGYDLAHLPRYIFLHQLLMKTGIQLWIDEVGQYSGNRFKSFIKNFVKKEISKKYYLFQKFTRLPQKILQIMQEIKEEKRLLKNENIPLPICPLHKKFSKRCYEPVYGLDMYKLLGQSRISFNKHSLAANGYSDNIRLFHTTGMGSCLLTDRGKNLSELFEEDYEIVAYTNFEECLEKIEYLLKNERARKEIANRGQKKTLKCHTAFRRAEQINSLLQDS